MIEQSENYWGFLRDIVVPAHWSSGDSWKGNWHGTVTAGPAALGLAKVVGGSGEFAGFQSAATESITAKAYSMDQGPVAAEAQLTIELPRIAVAED